MRYRWLLFDADGTLFDYDAAEMEALRDTFAESGLPYTDGTLAAYRRANQAAWVDFERGMVDAPTLRIRRFEELFLELGFSADPVAFSPRYLERLAGGVALVPGAERLLGALRGRVGLALITNGLKDVQRPRIARSALAGVFDPVVISDEIGAAKPSSDFFDHVFGAIGRPSRDDVLVIGDSLTSDIQGGNDYGLATCWYNPEGRPVDPRIAPTFQIRHLDELLGLVEAEAGGGARWEKEAG